MRFNRDKKKDIKRESIEVQTDLCMGHFETIDKKVVKLNKNVVSEQDKITQIWEKLQRSREHTVKKEHPSFARNNEVLENEERIGHLQGKLKKLEKNMKVFFEDNFDKSRTHAREIKDLYSEIDKQKKSQDELKSEIKETKTELKVERERTIKLESKMESMAVRSEQEKEEMHQKINEIHAKVANALPITAMQMEIESSRRIQQQFDSRMKRYDDALTQQTEQFDSRMKRYDDALTQQTEETRRIREQLEKVTLINEQTGHVRDELDKTQSKTQQLGKEVIDMREQLDKVEFKTDRLEGDTCRVRGKLERANLKTEQLEHETTRIREHVNRPALVPHLLHRNNIRDGERREFNTHDLEQNPWSNTRKKEYAMAECSSTCQTKWGIQETDTRGNLGTTGYEQLFSDMIKELDDATDDAADQTYLKVMATENGRSSEGDLFEMEFDHLLQFP